jgi:hypothetical protein
MSWILRILALACLAGCAPPAAVEPPAKPAGEAGPGKIAYVEADEATNGEALGLIRDYLSPSPAGDRIEGLSGLAAGDAEAMSPLMCMPALWSRIDDHPRMQAEPGIMLKLQVPLFENGRIVGGQELDGRAFRSRADHEAFWAAFAGTIALDADHVVRKLTEAEKQIYWSIVFWDIEEPVFIIESGSYSLLVDFWEDDGRCKLTVIEDMRGWGID